ncbi:hypothetical protein ELQ37_05560, partial [Pseudomonas aeruginosa]
MHGWFSWIRPWPGRIAAGGRRRCDSLLSYALWKGRSARGGGGGGGGGPPAPPGGAGPRGGGGPGGGGGARLSP